MLSRVPPTVHLNHLSAPALLDLAIIQNEVEKDQALREIRRKINEQKEKVPNFSLQQGALQFKGRLVLLKISSLLPTIMHTYHDSVFGGHRFPTHL